MAGAKSPGGGGLPSLKVKGSNISVAFLGYPLILFWFSSVNRVDLSGGVSGSGSLLALLSMVVDAAVLVGVACASARIGSLRTRCCIFVTLGVTVAASVVSDLVGEMALPVAAVVAGACVVGAAKALTALIWMEAFCALNMRGACIAFAATSIVGWMLNTVVPLAGEPFEKAFALVAGVAGVLVTPYASSADGPASEAEESDGVRRWSFPLQPTLLMGVYAFAYAFVLNAGFKRLQGLSVQDFADIAMFLAVLLVAVFAFSRFNVKGLSVVAAPLVCAGLLCTVTAYSWAFPAASALVALGFYSMSTFIYLLLFNISFRYNVNPLWLFGFSRAARVVGTFGASLVAGGLGVAGPGPACDAVVGVLLVVIVLAAMTLAAGKGFATTWGIRPVEGEAAGDVSRTATGSGLFGAAFEDRLAYVAYVWGLTKREEEVLGLLARGMGVPDIERELLISNGTVRNHVQHVYKKLGLHSRDDVRAFMADPDAWGKGKSDD